MDKKMMAGIGLGLAAVTAVGLLARPGRSQRRRMAVKAIGKAVDDLSGLMKIF